MAPVRVVSRVAEAIAEVEVIVRVLVAKLAHDIEAWAKVHAPYDTGYLKGSIRAVPGDGGAWIVQVGAEYAAYQELGTVNMPAQPYLLPAVEVVAHGAGAAAEVQGPAGAGE